MTSRDVVNVVQRIIKPTKVGHAGTLDPLATGVLLLCVGPATRLISVLQQSSKTYESEFLLGQTSDTDDVSGQLTEVPVSSQPSVESVKAALSAFEGSIEQTPPAFSAVKVAGKRAYALARAGQPVELKARQVQIDSVRLISYAWPKLKVCIDCGSGTYIRSVARDLGKVLGCGGLMSQLVRTRIGDFHVDDGINVEDITQETLASHLQPAVRIVRGLNQYLCNREELVLIQQGRQFAADPLRLKDLPDDSSPEWNGPSIALLSASGSLLLAIGELRGHVIQPRTVFATDSG